MTLKLHGHKYLNAELTVCVVCFSNPACVLFRILPQLRSHATGTQMMYSDPWSFNYNYDAE